MAKKITPKKGKITRLKANDLKNARGGLLMSATMPTNFRAEMTDGDMKETIGKGEHLNKDVHTKK